MHDERTEMNVREAAEALGCSRENVQRLIAAGQLPARKVEVPTGFARRGYYWAVPVAAVRERKERRQVVASTP